MYNFAGAALVAGIFLAFTVFIVRYYFQSTHWKDFFYKDAHVFAQNCGARFTGSDAPGFPESLLSQPIKAVEYLPHARGYFDLWRADSAATSPYYHAEYRCRISTDRIRIGKGANYMHLGWLFGNNITVAINDRQVLHLRGEEFVSFPVPYEDLIQPELFLTVRVSSTDGHRFGFASILPPAITTETKAHLNIFAIQPVFEMNNTVLPRVPTMCLGTLLAFAWMLGVRTRIMLTGMFYFVADLADGTLMMLGPYLPVAATKVHTLGLPLRYLAEIAVLCLLMEIFGILRTRIYSIMNISLAAAVVTFLVLLAWDGVFPYSQASAKVLDPVFFVVLCVLFAMGLKLRTEEIELHRRRLITATLILTAALIYRYGHEISRHFSWYNWFNISFYYRFALPMYLSGLVLYHLSAVERDLRQTAREKDLLSRRLSVKEDLIAIVQAGAAPAGSVQTAAAGIRWGESAGDGVWSTAWECASGASVFLCGRIIGGEEHAGLGMTAVTSALVGWRESRPENPAECIERLNQVFYSLFRGFVRTSVTALRMEKGGVVDVWTVGSSGMTPVLTIDGKRIEAGVSDGPAGATQVCRPAHLGLRLDPGAKLQVEPDERGSARLLSEITLAA